MTSKQNYRPFPARVAVPRRQKGPFQLLQKIAQKLSRTCTVQCTLGQSCEQYFLDILALLIRWSIQSFIEAQCVLQMVNFCYLARNKCSLSKWLKGVHFSFASLCFVSTRPKLFQFEDFSIPILLCVFVKLNFVLAQP